MNICGDIICRGSNLKPLNSYDLFVTSAGFEDRTLSGLERISNSTKFKKSVINLFKPDDIELFERNRLHLQEMENLISKISDDYLVVKHMPNNPAHFTQTLHDHFRNINSLLIDITSFTRLFLYSILNACAKNGVKAHILYSEPEKYTMNLARGLEDIIIMPTNPGMPDQSKKILMILFLGWESKRISSVIEEWEPDKLITFAEYSDDDTREHWNNVSIQQCLDLIEKSEFSRIPALLPKETLVKLEQIYEKHEDEYDLCLINGGPKIQCLAFSEFAFCHPEVQILYPKPYHWKQTLPNEDTFPLSVGKGKTYLFNYPIRSV